MPSRFHSPAGRSVVLVCLLALACSPRPSYGASDTLKPAPDFVLPYLEDGSRTVSLSDFRGQVLLLNLWASWCTGCRKEMSEFITLQNAYRKTKLAVVAVNLDDQKGRALSFLEKFARVEGTKPGFTTLYDADKTLAARLNPTAFPASYLIDSRGNLVRSYIGSISEEDLPLLRKEIDALLRDAR